MSCTEYRQIASARLDGQGAPDEIRRLEAHLASCEACRRAEQALKAVDAGLSLDPVAVPGRFKAALFERLEAEALLPPRKARLFQFPAWRWVAVPLAAAAGLAFFLLVGRYQPDAPAPAPQLARQAVPAARPEVPAVPAAPDAGKPAAGAAATVPAGAPEVAPARPGAAPSLRPLSPEESEVVAHLDLLEGSDSLDDLPPAGFDDLVAPASKGRG